jgi:hypothetical protein
MPFDAALSTTHIRHASDRAVLLVLQRARDAISQPGAWCQGAMRIPCTDRRCALGWVEFFGGRYNRVAIHAFDCLERAVPRFRMGVAQYNDDPTTTQRHVVALFDRAITAISEETQ